MLKSILVLSVLCISTIPAAGGTPYVPAETESPGRSIPASAAPDIPDQVWDVDISGNSAFSDMVLKEHIAVKAPSIWRKLQFWNRGGNALNETDVQKDVIRIRNYYRRRGFINVEVSYQIETLGKDWKKRVIFTVDENEPVAVNTVTYEFPERESAAGLIRSDRAFQRARDQHSLREGHRYEQIREPEVVGRFNDILKNMGFAFSTVTITANVDTLDLAADLVIHLETGPLTRFDNIEVEGNETVSDRFVLREAAITEGEQYSFEKIQTAQQELFNHHLFRFATITIPEQEEDSTLNLLVRVRENPPRSVQASVGFGNEEKLRGQVNWVHRNLFSRGHRLTVSGRASFIEQTFGLDYLFPYVYNTKSSFVISPFAQHMLEESYELFRAGLTNSFIYRYSRDLTGSASYEFTKNLELSQQFNAALPDSTLNYDLSTFRFTGYYNETFGRNQEGWHIQPMVQVSGLFGLATYSFQKLSVDVRRFTRLTGSTMLATRVQVGGLVNVAQDTLPHNIRLFLGGTSSVRGWTRQDLGPKRARLGPDGFIRYVPVGGRSMFSFNAEIRQELDVLFRGFGMAAFLDGGQVWRRLGSFDGRPVQFGAGGGLRYESPIGPLRIDVGYKLNPTPEDLNHFQGTDYGSAWDRIGIHFSIGQAF